MKSTHAIPKPWTFTELSHQWKRNDICIIHLTLLHVLMKRYIEFEIVDKKWKILFRIFIPRKQISGGFNGLYLPVRLSKCLVRATLFVRDELILMNLCTFAIYNMRMWIKEETPIWNISREIISSAWQGYPLVILRLFMIIHAVCN